MEVQAKLLIQFCKKSFLIIFYDTIVIFTIIKANE